MPDDRNPAGSTTMPDDPNPAGTQQDGEQPPAPTATPAEPQQASQGAHGPDNSPSGNAEAARYRRRLRETEAERDALADRVALLQRREVERLAAEHLAQPADLFDIGGAELADLLTEDGFPDADRVTQAAQALLKERPGLALVKPPGWPDMGQGDRGGMGREASWGRLLGGR